ncbi:MAG: translation initiation factor IF-2 [Rickettsiales bacterium]|nr:translation initiation factor IF-2 [Rickettsiales bacterium]
MKDTKRNILTLGSFKTKKDNVFNMSSTSKELIAERQKKLKEEQLARKVQQTQQNIKQHIQNTVQKVDDVNNVDVEGVRKDGDSNRHDDFKKQNVSVNQKDKKESDFDKSKGSKTESKGINNGKKKDGDNISKFNGENKSQNNSNFRKQQKDRVNTDYGYEDSGDKNNKRVFKDKSEKYSKNIHTYIINDDDDDRELKYSFSGTRRKNRKSNDVVKQNTQKIVQVVNIPDFISVGDLADRMSEKKADVVKKLFSMGIKATINQTIDAETAELLVIEFGHNANRVSDSDMENILKENEGTNFVARNPVVTVMGHVDHGKTSLLDALRTTKVAEGESGGITQHIGASRVDVGKDKFITFIDTPGHEAFTEMRMRGANITDIVVLVVAADDGVKDQTIEAINHTKAAKVPMIVAVNKIDKDGVDPERVKQELLQYDVVAEESGGDVMFVNVSAKSKIGLDKLLETILLQAEILDLKAPIDCRASGAVIESRMDVQRGAVATMLVQKGILKVGDIVLVGTSYGRVKKMTDDKKNNVNEAYPSMAVEVLGLNTAPNAGDVFNVVSTEKDARDIVAYREMKERDKKGLSMSNKTAESMLQQVKGSNRKILPIVLKCDVSGSIEAINGSLSKLNNDEVGVDVIHSAIGSITESDVSLAVASNAIIIAFNVRANNSVKDLIKEKGVEIRYYSIIYNIVDEVKSILSGLLKPTTKENVVGEAEVRNVFKITGAGKVAGCYVTSGEIRRNLNIKLIRDGIVIFDGKIKTLKRFKDDVKEVKNNYECGIAIENYDDIKEKDIIECYEVVEEKRSL